MSRRVARTERKGGANENYATPIWCVRRLLDEVDLPIGGCWLEPCAGGGNIIRAVAEREWSRDVMWTAIEIREDAIAKARSPAAGRIIIGDSFAPGLAKWDCVIMNPPFTMLDRFVAYAREVSPIVICLARLNWFASATREDFFQVGPQLGRTSRVGMPAQILVLPNRPSFSTDGATDSAEYCWAIWDRRKRSESVLRRLPLTPKAERLAARPKRDEARASSPAAVVYGSGECGMGDD